MARKELDFRLKDVFFLLNVSFSRFSCLLLGADAKPSEPFGALSDCKASIHRQGAGDTGAMKRGGFAHRLPVLGRSRLSASPWMTAMSADSEGFLNPARRKTHYLFPRQKSVKEALSPPMNWVPFYSAVIGFRIET